MIAALLVGSSVLALLAVVLGPAALPLTAGSLVAALTALGFSLSAGDLGATLASPWFCAAAASLLPLLQALLDRRSRAASATVAAGLLWPAAAMFVWQLSPSATPSPADPAVSLLLAAAIGVTGAAFARAAPGLLRAGEGKFWTGASLILLLAVAAAPWAGATSGVPLALEGPEGFAGPTARLGLLWVARPGVQAVPVMVVASVPIPYLGLLRSTLLYTSLAAGVMVLISAVTRSIAARHLLTITAVAATVAALTLPLASFFGVSEGTLSPDTVATASLARLGSMISVHAVLSAPGAGAAPHMLGLPAAAALLPAIAVAVLAGLSSRREGKESVEPTGAPTAVRVAAVVLGIAALAGLALTATLTAGAGFDRPPWPGLMAALVATLAGGLAARAGAAPERSQALGLWVAHVALLIMLVGPGEGWTV